MSSFCHVCHTVPCKCTSAVNYPKSQYVPYIEAIASTNDRIAWVLCQIIDDDAPLRWTRYRGVAVCIARNEKLMADLKALGKEAT